MTTRRANHFGLSKVESSPLDKNILLFRNRKSVYIYTHPVPLEGRIRIVRDAGRGAVDAAASGAQLQSQGEMNLVSGVRRAGRPALKRTAKACGPDSLWVGVKFRGGEAGPTGQASHSIRGRR